VQQWHHCASMVGRQRTSLPPIVAFWAAVVICFAFEAVSRPLAWAAEQSSTGALEYSQPISAKLNPTGRTVAFTVPLKDADVNLGDVMIQITAEDEILIEKTGFTTLITTALGEPAGAMIAALPTTSGFVAVEAVAATGLKARFDPGLQELQLVLAVEQRPEGDLSFSSRPVQRPSSQLAQPEFFSGYLNIVAGIDQNWDTGSTKGPLYDEDTSGRLELDSAVRVGPVVFENRAAYDGDVDASICPVGATCLYGHAAGLKRQSSRAVYDLPEHQVRLQAGDTDAMAVPMQRSIEVFGISLEKSAAKLNPTENVASTNAGSFQLAQKSSVDVIVNGAVVQRLQLRPGNYNLKDLPLMSGSNKVELIITSENGERSNLSFNAFSDSSLLAAGKSAWGVAGGLPSYLLDNERTYNEGAYLGTGYWRYGLTDDLTTEADVQGDESVVMAGVGFDIKTKFGIVGVHGAGSTSNAGEGAAVDLVWSLSNFEGLSGERAESLYVNAEYRSTDFHTPGEFLNEASGIIFPEFNYWLRLNGSYSLPVTGDITATVSGRYQFANEDANRSTASNVQGDRYGVDLTVSKPLSETVNASLLAGYSNELYVRDFDEENFAEQSPEFRMALRINWRPGDTTSVNGSYDSLGGQSSLSVYRGETQGLNRWDASVDVQNRSYEKSASVNAAAGYRSDRGELRLSHYADSEDVGFDDLIGNVSRQRTSLRASTAVAFAGSKVAIGAPVRGGAFAIVGPHETIADKEVTVGTVDNPRAIADGFGNALVPDLPAYLPGSVPVDVEDLPIGYSLGSASIDTFAPYKAGYAIEVGSDYSVSVFGTLLLANGEPVELAVGTATPESGSGKPVSLFTNAEGKFGAEGLAPGRWIIDVAAESGPTRFIVDVPEGTKGLIKVGTLKPVEGTTQ